MPTQSPRQFPRPHRVSCLLSDGEHAALLRMARAAHQTVSEYVRCQIREQARRSPDGLAAGDLP